MNVLFRTSSPHSERHHSSGRASAPPSHSPQLENEQLRLDPGRRMFPFSLVRIDGVRRVNVTFMLFVLLTAFLQCVGYWYVRYHVSVESSSPPISTTSMEPQSETAGPAHFTRSHYYKVAFIGGVLAGSTHLVVLPLDIIKCRVQVGECASVWEGFQYIYHTEAGRSIVGAASILFKGWVPTVIGYGSQCAFKYMFYEYFKSFWVPDPIQSAILGAAAPRLSKLKQSLVFVLCSGSAEIIADFVLVPWETTKLQMQTTSKWLKLDSLSPPVSGMSTPPNNPMYPISFSASPMMSKMWYSQGKLRPFYRGLGFLWMRQIPYTASKFLFFELSVRMFTHMYFAMNDHNVAKGDAEPTMHVSEMGQLVISLLSGIVAGSLASCVSHPADTILSKLTSHQREKPVRSSAAPRSSFPFLRHLTENPLFSNVWQGVLPRMVMGSLLTAMQWLVYDSVKVYSGFAATGSAPKQKKIV